MLPIDVAIPPKIARVARPVAHASVRCAGRCERGHGRREKREAEMSAVEPADASAAAANAPVVSSGDESNVVSGIAADFEHGHRLGRHRHRRAQLVYAVEGVMTVDTDAGLWVVPPLRALWVPAGVVHS